MIRKLLLPVVLLLSGCVSFGDMSPETRAEELTWQAVNAVDGAQTVHALRDGACFHETGMFGIFGSHPSSAETLAFVAVMGYAHAAITSFLIDEGWQDDAEGKWALRIWEALSIGNASIAVHNNYKAGVRLFEPNVRSDCQ